jgi:hypothetical protein
MTDKEPIKVEIIKPHIDALSDIFGGISIMVDGREFIKINYIAPYIDNAGMRSLSNKILRMIGGEPKEL